MLLFNSIALSAFFAFGAEHVLAVVSPAPGPHHSVAAVTPQADSVVSRFQHGQLTITTVKKHQNLKKRDDSPSAPTTNFTVDLTPADPSRWICYTGGFQEPEAEDCKVVIHAQLYTSTGSLAAFPGTLVYVSYRTCAVVLQNLDQKAPQVQYNWAMLGKAARNLFNACLTGKAWNIGGAMFFEKYLDRDFNGLYITLQRFDDSELPPPEPATNANPKPVGM
ncbi:secreted protein [Melampsora americana]|nr:secreted protein [Melampsora americana]